MKNYVELTDNGYLGCKKIQLRVDDISGIFEPEDTSEGCLIQVGNERFQVKESYSAVCTAVEGKSS